MYVYHSICSVHVIPRKEIGADRMQRRGDTLSIVKVQQIVINLQLATSGVFPSRPVPPKAMCSSSFCLFIKSRGNRETPV